MGLPNDRLLVRMQRISLVLGAVVALVGGGVLLGWAVGNTTLTNVLPGLPAMMPWTAVGFLVTGTLLMLKPAITRHSVASWPAAGVVFLGLYSLAEYANGWNSSFDLLLFGDRLRTTVATFPGRMSPQTAMCFLLMGLALLLANKETRRGHRPAQSLALLAGLLALHALIGYSFGVAALYGISAATGMAIHTTCLFLLLTVGILLRNPDRGDLRERQLASGGRSCNRVIRCRLV